MSPRAPNVLLLITDQQRYPCHWPEDPGWLRDLMPNDQRLADTGLTFRRAFCNTSMCSPSRATLLTGQYPAQHGVTLTHTQADLRPDPRNLPAVTATLVDILRTPGAPRQRAMRGFGRGLLQLGPKSGDEPELQPDTPNLAQMLRAAGLRGRLQGQVAPDPPGGHRLAAGRLGAIRRRSAATRLRVRRLGAARRRREREGRALRGGQRRPAGRRDGTSSTRGRPSAGSERADLPEPFCLVVSLVNPHDVLGYPAQYVDGGYTRSEFRDLDVRLPPTLVEDMRNKPTVHELMRMGMTAYLGPLNGERAKLDYVNFYAHLHRVVDAQIGRLLDALGDPADPALAALSHGDLPLRRPRRDGALARRPAPEGLQRLRGDDPHPPGRLEPGPLPEARPDRRPRLADRPRADDRHRSPARTSAARPTARSAAATSRRSSPSEPPPRETACERRASISTDWFTIPRPAPSAQEEIHFTYDDHQAATALQNVPGQPNRIRAVRTARHKFAIYFDPEGKAATEYEMYDLERDPDERHNLVDRISGEPLGSSDRRMRLELGERLESVMEANGTNQTVGIASHEKPRAQIGV